MTHKKVPTYLTADQRQVMMEIPRDLDARDLARHYTFTEQEIEWIHQHRRPSNRLGCAVQLALLRFPGRPLTEYQEVPRSILQTIAQQIDVPMSAFDEYGTRLNTIYEHFDEIQKKYGYRACKWQEYLAVARYLLPHALESDRAVPLIELALEFSRSENILPPTLVQIERLVWVVLRLASDRLYTTLTSRLTIEHKTRLDARLQNENRLGGHTRLAWLRAAPGEPSPRTICARCAC